MLGGGASRTAGEFVEEIELALVEAAEAAEMRVFSAVAKASSVPFELGVALLEEPVVEGDLEASMRDKTESTEFLF